MTTMYKYKTVPGPCLPAAGLFIYLSLAHPRLFREHGLLRLATKAGWRVTDHGRPANHVTTKRSQKNTVRARPPHKTIGNVGCTFHSPSAGDHTVQANNSDIVGQYSQEINRQLKPIAESDDFILILGGTTASLHPIHSPLHRQEPRNPSNHTPNHARMQVTTPFRAAHCRLSEHRVRQRAFCGSAL